MEQKNVNYGTPRRVRRRPIFISSVGVQTARTSKKRGPVSSQYGKGVPGYQESAVPETGYKRVALLSTDRDYLKVQELFCKTLSGFDIISIERIQNKELWEDFQTKRERMTKANKDKKYVAGERLLFHGTDSKFIHSEGCYFARDACYFNSYTSDHGVRSMFVSRVLVGSYTQGQSQYSLPPPIDGGLLLYDSCVNDVRDPSIFVVFDKQQVYPEFLITYTEHVYPTDLTGSSPDYASSAVSGLLSPVKTTATSTQSNSAHSSTTLTGITSALKTVTVSTLTSSSFVSPPSVVSSPSLSSVKPSRGSPQSSVINPILIPPSFVSPPSVVSSPSLSSAKPSTASPQSSVMNPILYPPSSSLKPAQVLPATRTSAGSATLPAPVPASTSSMLPNSHPLQAVQMRKSDVSSDDCDFEFVDSFYSPSSKSTSTALSNPGRSSSSALNQQWVPKPVPSRRLYSSSDASLVSTTMRSATPKSTSTRRVSPPRLSTTTSSSVTLPTSPRSQDLYNVPSATRRQNHGAKKKEECILL
ncbi:mucin-5AC-like [Clupea harengus]|uniref:Mucin-5AC-like n=1 Tax=Clupea harengus TaxID=7950 RepID=A0A8M1KN56_CLUHA|nr:mucin-5AC-like [Clupea harengus]